MIAAVVVLDVLVLAIGVLYFVARRAPNEEDVRTGRGGRSS